MPRLNRLDIRHCPSVTQTPASLGSTEGHDERIWRYGPLNNRIEVISDESCGGAVTPENYIEEYGVVDGWNDVHTATGLWQLLQSIAAVRAAAELQARATAEAQAEDMLVEAAEVQARASEIHAQAIDMQAQAAEILSRVAEVQLQVSAMQVQAEEQGHVAARAQAAEMQAQVAQMQVHAAQMQVHAAQMQIRATEMQGQAAEMQASALSIRAQASTLSFAELTNTAANAITNVSSQEAGAADGVPGAATDQVAGEQVALPESSASSVQPGHSEDAGHQIADSHHDSGSTLEDQFESGPARATAHAMPAAAATAETMGASGTADVGLQAAAGGTNGQQPQRQASSAEPMLVASSGNAMAASARFEAVREETARLTRCVFTAHCELLVWSRPLSRGASFALHLNFF